MAKRRRDSGALKQQPRAREAARERAEGRRPLIGFLAAAVLALAATAVVAIAVTDGSDDGSGGHAGSGSGLAHVHGLGVNPKDRVRV